MLYWHNGQRINILIYQTVNFFPFFWFSLFFILVLHSPLSHQDQQTFRLSLWSLARARRQGRTCETAEWPLNSKAKLEATLARLGQADALLWTANGTPGNSERITRSGRTNGLHPSRGERKWHHGKLADHHTTTPGPLIHLQTLPSPPFRPRTSESTLKRARSSTSQLAIHYDIRSYSVALKPQCRYLSVTPPRTHTHTLTVLACLKSHTSIRHLLMENQRLRHGL